VTVARQRRFDLLYLAEDRLGALVQDPALVGQCEPARGARNRRRVLKCSSSAEICRLTDVNELGSDRAAADRLPASTARTKVAMADTRSIDPSAFRKGVCKR